MAWAETEIEGFMARHAAADGDAAERVLHQLENTRARLAGRFPAVPGDVTVVLHGSQAQLDMALPFLPLVRRRMAPAARPYLAGWAGRGSLHVLAPRVLTGRATGREGSGAMLQLTPAALYTQLAISASNPVFPPPWGPRTASRAGHWAWLVAGAAQWFSGQTALARPTLARMLRDGARPAFPPRLADAIPFGGTVVDLLVREEGERAAVDLVCIPQTEGAHAALRSAFGGRKLVHTEGTWRAHLARLAGDGLRQAS